MAAKRQKHPTQLINRRPERIKALAPLGSPPAFAPDPPSGLLKVSKDAWFDFWASPAASVVSMEQHGTALRDWIRHRDEWERVYKIFRRSTMVRGSVGQLRLNPLSQRLSELRAIIDKYEAKFGLTPLDTMRLGFETNRAVLTAEGLRKALQEPGEDEGWIEGEIADGDRRIA